MESSGNGVSSGQPIEKDIQKGTGFGDEIDLKDYIEVIIRRKGFILKLFFGCTIFTAIISLCLPRTYEATASIMIMPSRLRTALLPADVSLEAKGRKRGEYTEQKPSISITTHKTLVKSNTVLERLVNKLKSKGVLKKDIPIEVLLKRLDVSNTENTNVLQLAARDANPERARQTVNIWADEYVRYSSEIILGEVKGTGDFVFQQFQQAETNLARAEQAVRDFEVAEEIPFLEIELRENQNQLQGHYARIYNLEFVLAEKKHSAEQILKELDKREQLKKKKLDLKEKRGQLGQINRKVHQLELIIEQKRELLQRVNGKLAAMSKDGIWIGSFHIKEAGLDYFVDSTLSQVQDDLRRRVLEAKLFLEDSVEKRDSFINTSKINLTREEVGRSREQLLTNKVLLSNLTQLRDATGANLKSKAKLSRLEELSGPIAEKLSDFTVWEILSLMEGYNFFETRERFLERNVKKQAAYLAALEEAQMSKEEQFKVLDETVGRAEAIYGFYRDQFKSLEKQRGSLELETAEIESELSSSRKLAERLDKDVRALQMAFDKGTMDLSIRGVDANDVETGNIEFRLSYSRGLVRELEEKVRSLKVDINGKKAKLEQLNRNLEVCRRTYNLLVSKIDEAQLAQSLELGEVKVVSSAFKPEYPIRPKKKLNVAVAGLGSLIIGVFIAVFQESRSNR